MASAALSGPGLPPPAAAPVPPPARVGDLIDDGVVRRGSVRASRWTVHGFAKVTGEVDVDTWVVEGTASVGGKVSASDLRATGTVEISADASIAHLLALDGNTHVVRTLHAGDIDTKGSLRVGGAVDVDRAVLWRGTLEVGGSLKASRLAGEGRLAVVGAVAAKEVDLVLEQPSTVRSITAETVRVRVRHRPLREPPFLTVERIEADMVELEGVHVEYLRASQIIAGAGCQIARFDGSVVRKHASARLGPSSISARPHGLSV
jgi:cytoskeletal protein CcmA (bactofilin family)